jgi:hypothetical protein
MSGRVPDHESTQPIRTVGQHRRRGPRGRPATVIVLLVVLALGLGALAAVRSMTSTSSGLSRPTSTPSPLLPGAPVVATPLPAAPFRVSGTGYDVSYPQCRAPLPGTAAFGIVGVNGGAPLTTNKCFAAQIAWAKGLPARAVYVNTAYTGGGDPVDYGRGLADDAVAREHAAGGGATSMWWLDVEITNTWRGTTQENATVLAAMAARLQALGARVGIYSTPEQWTEIAGTWAPGLPVWNAVGPGDKALALQACTESFAGSTTAIAQWVATQGGRRLDHDIVCPAWRDRGGEILQPR